MPDQPLKLRIMVHDIPGAVHRSLDDRIEAPVHRMDGANQHLFSERREEDTVCLAALADDLSPKGNPCLGGGEPVHRSAIDQLSFDQLS